MEAELSVPEILRRLVIKFGLEFFVGGLSLLLLTAVFDLGVGFADSFADSFAAIVFGPIAALFFISMVTFYLPFSLVLGVLLNLIARFRRSEEGYAAAFVLLSMVYIFAGIVYANGGAPVIAIGVSLIAGNTAYLLIAIRQSRRA